MWSWLVIAVIAFVVLGPKEMPAAMRKLARYMGRFRRMSDEFKRQIMSIDVTESDGRQENGKTSQGISALVMRKYDTIYINMVEKADKDVL